MQHGLMERNTGLPTERTGLIVWSETLAGKEIERETLNTIIHMRMRESLELLKRELDRENFDATRIVRAASSGRTEAA